MRIFTIASLRIREKRKKNRKGCLRKDRYCFL
jgi:hypothetical protein